MTAKRRQVALAAVAAAVIVGAGYVAWRQIDRSVEHPTVVCSLPDPQPCQDTATSISLLPDWALDPRPAARVTAIDVRPAVASWARSDDPSFRLAEWSTWIELDDGPPILAACSYSSEHEVTCDTLESAWASPSDHE